MDLEKLKALKRGAGPGARSTRLKKEDPEKARLRRTALAVEAAYAADPLMPVLAAGARFEGNGRAFRVEHRAAADLTQRDRDRAMALLDANMPQHYPGKWETRGRRDKAREMVEGGARYLLAYPEGGEGAGGGGDAGDGSAAGGAGPAEAAGFVQYRFLEDDGDPVLYLYEIQLAEDARGCGLGQHLSGLCQALAEAAGMTRVVLTVHRTNEGAERFYRRLGFTPDRTDPEVCNPRSQAGYRILSKRCTRAPRPPGP